MVLKAANSALSSCRPALHPKTGVSWAKKERKCWRLPVRRLARNQPARLASDQGLADFPEKRAGKGSLRERPDSCEEHRQ